MADEEFVYQAGKALVTLLRHDNKKEVRGKMDTAGWVAVDDLLATRTMREFRLQPEEVNVLLELENRKKTRFLRSLGADGVARLKAAQGHSAGVASRLNPDEALEPITPSSPNWSDVGYHGTTDAARGAVGQVVLGRHPSPTKLNAG